MSSLLDEVFVILETAERLEKNGSNRIEAATKYYEAVYLMQQVLQHTPMEAVQTRELLDEKIREYSEMASRLYFDDRSSAPSPANIPRSPTHGQRPSNFGTPAPPPSADRESQYFTLTAELNRKAREANARLARAIELDESGHTQQAIDDYIAAAELYLDTVRLCEKEAGSSSQILAISSRLERVMDRIEELKHPNRDVVSQPRSTDAPNRQDHSSSLTREEVEILVRSSKIASGLFLPWSEEEANSLSDTMKRQGQASTLYRDKSGDLELSKKQRTRIHRWARPVEIARMRNGFGRKQLMPTMIKCISPYSIRQKCVTDCSFIASLCICAAFEKKFRKSLITPIIYPQDERGVPRYNPEGKYMVKLWLNGVARQVVVDDRLPVDQNSNLLCSHTSGSENQLELWVSIIEKAYMKLCGGYDFPGSNSGVDLFSLTGWIPERVYFPQDQGKVRDFETPPERAWDRLFSASSFGDCLITVSTTRDLTEDQAEALGLVTGHAYAVLEVVQTGDGVRLLQMKNPWASKGWTGKYSPHDRRSWQNHALRREIDYNPDIASKHDDGVFWISWEDVLRYFQNIHLSWNPELFKYRVTLHSFWPGNKGPINDTFNVGENPQYVVVFSDEALKKNAKIWILISRHVTKQEQEGADATDFLTIHLLRNNKTKERMWYPHGRASLVNGAYTNNPHVLVRYEVTGPEDKFVSLVLSQHQKSQDLGYTLSCYCTEPFSMGPPENDLPHVEEVVGSWTTTTAAGPIGKDNYFNNPLFLLTLSDVVTMQLRCSTMKSYAVNVILLSVPSTQSSDIRDLARRRGKPVLDSGNYRHGFVVTEKRLLQAGTYVLVASTFEPGNLGDFFIKAATATETKIRFSRVP